MQRSIVDSLWLVDSSSTSFDELILHKFRRSDNMKGVSAELKLVVNAQLKEGRVPQLRHPFRIS